MILRSTLVILQRKYIETLRVYIVSCIILRWQFSTALMDVEYQEIVILNCKKFELKIISSPKSNKKKKQKKTSDVNKT